MAAPGHPPMAGNPTGDFDFNFGYTLADPLRTQAINRFHTVVDHFQARESLRQNDKNYNYNRPALVRYTFEYACSSESQDRFLSAFFYQLRLGMADGDGDINLDDDLGSLLFAFAEDLMNNFFIPLRAGGPTPQLIPLSDTEEDPLSGTEEDPLSDTEDPLSDTEDPLSDTEEEWDHMGTPKRPSTLRSTCLVRDRHRCVVTRAFDSEEVCNRAGRKNLARDDGVEVIPRDDDGNELTPDQDFAMLKVAHILPCSLTKQMDKTGVLDILNMLDFGIVGHINGDIDQPHNAMSMTHHMHSLFGEFNIVFERIPGTPHTYCIKAFNQWTDRRLPLTRTLFPHPTIPAPSERLLALHCAIGHILYHSAAGWYIDRFLEDMEEDMEEDKEDVVQADGSTPLDVMVRVALG